MKKLNGILWCVALIVLGLFFSLSALDVIATDIFFTGWWTLFIIVPCLIGFITEKDKTASFIGLCVGVILLLCARKILSFAIFWKLLVPAIIVIIGIRLIIGSIIGRDDDKFKRFKKEQNSKNGTAVFSGCQMSFNGENFNGADLTAVFGGVECDLRGAIFDGDKTLRATAIFGGVDIIVPENVKVVINTTGIFGGAEDKRHLKSEGQYTLYITATAVFGGVDVK